MRCVILDDYQTGARRSADWERLVPRVQVESFVEHIADKNELAKRLAGAQIAVAIRERTVFDRDLLSALPDLKLLVTFGMANASIDINAARENGITVCGTTGAGNPTVEMTWSLILALARQLTIENQSLRDDGTWQKTLGFDLFGKTLGLVGLGRVGTGVARVAVAFGMNVLAHTPTLTATRAAEAGVEPSSFEDLLSGSDIVSIHAPLTPATHSLFDQQAFAMMRPGALLINTSRGPIVNEPALIEALQTGHLRGAALDVFDVEPLPARHPYRTTPNLLATPHLGYVTADNYAAHSAGAVEDIESWLQNSPIRVLT